MTPSRSAHADTFCRDNLPPATEWPELLDVPGVRYPERLNAGVELLDATSERLGPGRRCLIAPGETPWTYGQLRRVSNQIVRVLVEDHGVVPGNRVLMRGTNTPWLVACWFGVLKAGAVAVPTMPLLRGHELEVIADIAGIDFALCESRYADELRAAEIDGLRIAEYGGTQGLAADAAQKPETDTAVGTAADDVALLGFTSGTTGRPKGTMHTHRDLLAVADTFSAHVLKPEPDDVFTGTPPLAFTFGLGGLVVFPFRVGASTLLVEKATPEQLADLIAEYEVSVCFTAPTAYRAMVSSRGVERLATLRRGVSAGEHLPAATWHAVHDATGVKLIDGIGSTEMLHIFLSAADDDIKPGAVGRAVPGYVAAILDEDGTRLPPGTSGRLAVKGPTGCRYLADDRQRTYVQDTWNITGDTFVQDEEGYFWYQARSDDMIVSSGYNIASPEVEEALLAHADVTECAVIGVADESRGQVVTALVVLRDGVRADEAKTGELQEFVKARIAPYKYPRQICYRASLPKTANGKVQRFRLRAEFSANQAEA